MDSNRYHDKVKGVGFMDAPVALAITVDHVIHRCNHEFARIYRSNIPDLLGRLSEVLFPSRLEFRDFVERARIALACDGRYVTEREMRRGDGSLFWARIEGRVTTLANGESGVVWTDVDLMPTPPLSMRLTARERDVLRMLVRGMSCKETARDMGLSPRTVEMHRSRLLRKFGAGSAVQLLRSAYTPVPSNDATPAPPKPRRRA